MAFLVVWRWPPSIPVTSVRPNVVCSLLQTIPARFCPWQRTAERFTGHDCDLRIWDARNWKKFTPEKLRESLKHHNLFQELGLAMAVNLVSSVFCGKNEGASFAGLPSVPSRHSIGTSAGCSALSHMTLISKATIYWWWARESVETSKCLRVEEWIRPIWLLVHGGTSFHYSIISLISGSKPVRFRFLDPLLLPTYPSEVLIKWARSTTTESNSAFVNRLFYHMIFSI